MNSDKPLLYEKPTKYLNTQLVFDLKRNKTEYWVFFEGQTLDLNFNFDLKFTSKLSEKRMLKYDFLPNSANSPLVNKKVLDLLNEYCPNDFQLIPAKIGKYDKNDEFQAFDIEAYLINFLHLVTCIDLDKSDVWYREVSPSNIGGIDKLAFIPGCMGERLMARANEYHVLMLFAPKLVKIFKQAGFQGARFLTAEEDYGL